MSDETQSPAQTFTEAPVSWNVRYYSADGFDCMLTLRGMSGQEVFERVENAMDWLTRHGCRPAKVINNGNGDHPGGLPPVHPGQPTGAPPAPTVQETIEVATISHAVTEKGAHYLRIKGGKFSKFGVKAWPEVLPTDAKGFESWQIGEEFGPFPSMTYAVVEGSKVIAFKS